MFLSTMKSPVTDIQTIRTIDFHIEGEPTRVIIGGGPLLKGKSLAE